MSNSKKNIRNILLENGMLFPTTPEDVSRFLKINEISNNEKPVDWENPLEIIKRGTIELKTLKLNPNISFENELNNLAMVAREGKAISKSILDKMKEDRKNAKK